MKGAERSILEFRILLRIPNPGRSRSHSASTSTALLRWTALDLASASKVGVATIRRAESLTGRLQLHWLTKPRFAKVWKPLAFIFIEDNGGGEGVRFRKPRRRARQEIRSMLKGTELLPRHRKSQH